MTNLGKKILSAFVEVTEDKTTQGTPAATRRQGTNPSDTSSGQQDENPVQAPGSGQSGRNTGDRSVTNTGGLTGTNTGGRSGTNTGALTGRDPGDQGGRFRDYFDQLFAGTNMPGPDYYEFSKMILAMQAMPDEQARFRAAYAGLQAQGLDREKLLSTANEYLQMLAKDANNFQATADRAMQEKVHGKAAALKEKNDRIDALAQEIKGLQEQIVALQAEIKENEDKIVASTAGYGEECQERQARIQGDIEKIKRYIL